ncbi:MAG: hypothetical protein ACRBK7_05460 [Acidimicrobiales bacterium]
MKNLPYDHRQSTTNLVLAVMAITSVVAILAALGDGLESAAGIIVFGAMMTAVVFVFSELRTTVDESNIIATFRLGWPKRTVPISALSSSQTVRNKWWYGFGVRLIPDGWMYNIWGLDAVEIRYDRGERHETFRIGTNDPEGLAAAIAAARQEF